MKTIFVDAVVCEIVYRRCQWRTPRHGDFCVLRTLSKIVRSSNAQRNNFWKSTLLNEFTENSASLIVYSSRVLHNYRIMTAACVRVIVIVIVLFKLINHKWLSLPAREISFRILHSQLCCDVCWIVREIANQLRSIWYEWNTFSFDETVWRKISWSG